MTTNHLVCAFLRRCISQMKRMGLNQSTLAKRMNVSRAYIAKLMSGDVNITFGTAMKLARALEMDFFPTLTPRRQAERKGKEILMLIVIINVALMECF